MGVRGGRGIERKQEPVVALSRVDGRTNVQYLRDEIDRHEESILKNVRVLRGGEFGVSAIAARVAIRRFVDALVTREAHLDQEFARQDKAWNGSEAERNAFLDSQISVQTSEGKLVRLTPKGIEDMNFRMDRMRLTGEFDK